MADINKKLYIPYNSSGLICLIVFFFSFSAQSIAATNAYGFSNDYDSNYDKGAVYFAQGDYISALSLWKPLANQGNALALYSISLLYEEGHGVRKDSKRALNYLQAAVDKNLAVAQYYLGMKYYAGLGVQKNTRKARQLFEQAAQSDYLQDQFQLANFYDKGIGGPQDPSTATQWFIRAAENGYGPDKNNLPSRFIPGGVVLLNFHGVIFWLNNSPQKHDSDAMRDLAYMYYKGIGVDQNFQQAHDLLLTPAEEGSGLALFLLGEIYATGGHGIDKNLTQSKKWFLLSQKTGYKEAQKRLQQLSKHSASLDKDKIKHKKKKNQPSLTKTLESRLAQDAQRFKQLNDAYYFLQIVAAKSYNGIRQLTNQYSDDSTYFFKIKKDGTILFILTYGYYQNYSEAKQAISQLPKIFQLKSQPWIRQVKQLKPSIL